jgi:hypothetical protein
MLWYISKLVDTPEEFQERRYFYSELTKRELFEVSITTDLFILCDGRKDNRCMIIGHTDTAFNVIKLLKDKSRKKYKFYLSVCIMSNDCYIEMRKQTTGDELYLSMQEKIMIGRELYLGCAFLDKVDTGLGFRATRSELNMYNSKLKGFSKKLTKSFICVNDCTNRV